MNKAFLLIIHFIFIALSIVNGQDHKKVAVFDPVGEVPQNLKTIIREELSNAVVNTLGFTVLERELINKVMAESQFQMTGHVDDGQIGELGKKMGANYVCYATISQVGENFYISCKMVDVLTAKIERQNTGITKNGLNDLFTMVSTVSKSMLQQQGSTPTTVTTATTTRKISQPTQKKYTPQPTLDPNALVEIPVLGMSVIVMPADITKDKINWENANKACTESDAYGFNDWRLPSKTEASELFSHKASLNNIKPQDESVLGIPWWYLG